MLMYRRFLRTACCVIIGALLFAQAAFATRPCVEPGMSAAAAISAQSDAACCETSVTEINLCALQCGDSNKLPGPVPVAVPLPAAVGLVELLPAHDHGAKISLRFQRNLVADPPPTLRFCRFVI
jgi:hypothetical protein